MSCWPKGTPEQEHLLACRQNLIDQWEAFPGDIILVCGTVAMEALMPNIHRKVRHGSFYRNRLIPIHNKFIFPVYHPSHILREHAALAAWKQALRDFRLITLVQDWLDNKLKCYYCGKDSSFAEYHVSVCLTHMKWWREDQRWKMPPMDQLNLL